MSLYCFACDDCNGICFDSDEEPSSPPELKRQSADYWKKLSCVCPRCGVFFHWAMQFNEYETSRRWIDACNLIDKSEMNENKKNKTI